MKHQKIYYLIALITALSLLLTACQPSGVPTAVVSNPAQTVPTAPVAATVTIAPTLAR